MDISSKIKLAIVLSLLVAGCSGPAVERKGEAPISEPPPVESLKQQETAKEEAPLPSFDPVGEDITPLNKRLICVSVRATPFRDVIKVIADAASLNLVLEKGVNTEVPVTVTLNNVTVKNAVDIVFSSVNYFYEINRNLLIVKAQDTRIFEFGHPNVNGSYSVNLGGDILGGATTSSTTGGSTSSVVKGDVQLSGKADDKAKNLWDELSASLDALLKKDEGSSLRSSFSINRMTGTIVVTASKKTLDDVAAFLGKIRESLSRQVLIEARIVEVQLSDGLKYGIDWNLVQSWKGFGGTMSAQTQNFASIVPSTGPAFNFAVIGSDFTMLLNALQSQGNVRVLSNPRISLMNGQTALLSVGRNTNFISRVQTTTTAATTGTIPQTTFTIDTSSVLSGLMIGLVPYINQDGNVSMTITPIVSDLVNLEDKQLGTVGANNISVSLPTVDLREMSTTVRVKNEEMVVIGGLITNKQIERDNGIPFLCKIPLLGLLFKSKEKSDERSELVIMLKPTVTKMDL